MPRIRDHRLRVRVFHTFDGPLRARMIPMRVQFTLRALFGWTTLSCGLAGSLFAPSPFGTLSLVVVLFGLIAFWPRLFGHGG